VKSHNGIPISFEAIKFLTHLVKNFRKRSKKISRGDRDGFSAFAA
jgi:hypothetical protein